MIVEATEVATSPIVVALVATGVAGAGSAVPSDGLSLHPLRATTNTRAEMARFTRTRCLHPSSMSTGQEQPAGPSCSASRMRSKRTGKPCHTGASTGEFDRDSSRNWLATRLHPLHHVSSRVHASSAPERIGREQMGLHQWLSAYRTGSIQTEGRHPSRAVSGRNDRRSPPDSRYCARLTE